MVRAHDWFGILLFALQAPEMRSAEREVSGVRPYPTGSHLQLVRKFFTISDGLPGDDVRAVTATRDNAVLVASGNGVARLEGEQWVKEAGPSEVTALFAPAQGPSALAGGTNGVWALEKGQWQIEGGSPTRVIAFSSEPGGIPWALAPSGVWRRENGWQLIHTIADDVLAQPHS